MRKNLFLSIIILSLFSVAAFAQTVIKPTLITGEVSSISTEKVVLKTANGEVEVALSDKTKYLRIPPDNLSTSAAVPSSFSEIGVGDKVTVSVIIGEDKKAAPARTVYLMSKSDISQRQAKFTEDWKKRGTYGLVDRYDLATKIVTISTRSFGVEKKISVKLNDKTEFYRYAPDTVEIELSDATRSKLTDVQIGDQIRVLGNKNTEGTEIDAEKIVTGSFKQSGGTIKSINLEKQEVVITDFETKKDVTVTVSSSSILKQFPPEMAERMKQFQMMQMSGQGGFRPPTQGNQQPNPQPTPQPQGQTQGQTPNGAGQGGFRPAGGGGGGIDDSRFPNIKIEDLKVGEMIGILSTKNNNPTQIKAIKLFSGVEPFIKMAEMAQAARQGGGNRGGGGASLSIPGLDGFGGN